MITKQSSLLTLVLLLCSSIAWAQVEIFTEVPNSITACGAPAPLHLKVYNNGASSLQDLQVTVTLPEGIHYQPGSLTEQSNTSITLASGSTNTQPAFTASDLAAGDSLVFSIDVLASSAAVAMVEGGAVLRNQIDLSYTGGTASAQSSSYNLLYAALNITNISPTSVELLSGETFDRSITIVNAGFGSLTEFYLVSSQATEGLMLQGLSLGQEISNTDRIRLSAEDFRQIGNGDDFFDSNEQLTLTQTWLATACDERTVSAMIQARWGCSPGADRLTSVRYAHAALSYQKPNIRVEATEFTDACFGTGELSRQALLLSNTGQGLATKLSLDLFKTSGSGYDQDIFSAFQNGSFQYKSGNGNWQTISPVTSITTRNDGAYSCLGSSPIGEVTLQLPDLPAGEQLTLQWDLRHCLINACIDQNVKGWGYELEYKDICSAEPYRASGTPQSPASALMTLFTESPADIKDGEKETYYFSISSFSNELPEGTDPSYEVVFDIPQGLNWSGNSNDLRLVSGSNVWAPLSVTYQNSTRQLQASYALPAPFDLPKSEFQLDLTGDCTGMSQEVLNTLTLQMSIGYRPDAGCAYSIPFACGETVTTDLHCPGEACLGLRNTGFFAERHNYGQPDANQDGLPDASGSINQDLIKTNRLMVNDTLRTHYSGFVGTDAQTPSFAYGYAEASIELGANLTGLSGAITIYDASQGNYLQASGLPVSRQLNGQNATFTTNFSAAVLAGFNPAFASYQYEAGDSIRLAVDYVLSGNLGGALQEVTISNNTYLSNDAAAPTKPGSQYKCDQYNDRFTMIGYYFSNSWASNYTVRTCTRTVQQNFWMSIGDCCSNYAGGNLFPYEYRNWGNLYDARVTLPPNYTLLQTDISFTRTRSTNQSVTQTVSDISPSNQSGLTYTYDLESLYTSGGGAVPLSDEGFAGTLSLTLAPTCDVPVSVYEPIDWQFRYRESEELSGQVTDYYTASPDHIRYSPTSLVISSPAPIIDGLEKTVTWTVDIKNMTNKTDAGNAWVRLQSNSGNIEIVSVVEEATGLPLTASADIYPLGTINRNSKQRLLVTGRYTACSVEKLFVFAGYECAGYPESFAAFACPKSDYELRVEPKPANIQAISTGRSTGDECSPEFEVTLQLASVRLAIADSVQFGLQLPPNALSYVPGSAEIRYPLSGNWAPMPDPQTKAAGLLFPLFTADSRLQERGLPGVPDLDSNRVQVRYRLLKEAAYRVGDYALMQVSATEACGKQLPTIQLAYDPAVRFERNTLAGIGLLNDDAWSVSWADYNNDGYPDAFFTEYSTTEASHLYRNNGDGTFTDVAAGALTTDRTGALASTWGDYDNDGDLDVFIANNLESVDVLYRNNGDGTFSIDSNFPAEAGYSHSASWADYDQDGWLDLLVLDYMPTRFNRLYHNRGDGTFDKVDNAITRDAAYSIGLGWEDYDLDGDPDLFISNDRGADNLLYRNEGNGLFTKITNEPLVSDGGNSVGASWGDYDNDGYPDLFVANAGNQNNLLYHNRSGTGFDKVADGSIVTQAGHSHGSAWTDIDNDGDLDLYVTNDQDSPNFLYLNQGDGTFRTADNLLTQETGNSFGAAFADYDKDGDADLLIAQHSRQPNVFYTNTQGTCQQYLCVDLQGIISNRAAIGARVAVKATIYGQPVWQTRSISAQTGGGAGSQEELVAHFGLGDATQFDSLVIYWPSGQVQTLTNQASSRCYHLTEPSGTRICGQVYQDLNANCQYDAGEPVATNARIRISPGNRIITTNANGNYIIYLSNGSYTLAVQSNAWWSADCVETVLHLSGTGESCQDLGVTTRCLEAELEIALGSAALRRGFQNQLQLAYANKGAAAANSTQLDLTLPVELTIVKAVPSFTSSSLGTVAGTMVYSWDLGTLPAGQTGTIEIIDSVALSAALGQLLTLEAAIDHSIADCAPSNNLASLTDEVVGSLDPNDKLVWPKGFGAAGYITPDDTLTYTIRFQNVGNFPATFVEIRDSLSTWFDQSEVQLLQASHPCQFTRQGNVLIWFFDNINLPDSVNNEPESHGFVRFRVQPQPGTPAFTEINNRAAIKFDFNEYLITNQVHNTLLPDQNLQQQQLLISPNPVSTETTVSILIPTASGAPRQIASVQLYDMAGNEVFARTGINDYVWQWPGLFLKRGSYLLVAQSREGARYTGKLVID